MSGAPTADSTRRTGAAQQTAAVGTAVHASSASAAGAKQGIPAAYGPFSANGLSDDAAAGLERICGNDDYLGMRSALTRGSEQGLVGRDTYLTWNSEHSPVSADAVDLLGFRIKGLEGTGASAEAMTAAVSSADAATDHIEAACVMATDMIVREELEGMNDTGPDGLGKPPSPDCFQHRHTLRCIAAHPNASPRSVRQAIRAEGKYSAREVLRRSSDPDLLRFALDEADVGIWHAVSEHGSFNPALPADRLNYAVACVTDTWRRAKMSRESSPHGPEYDDELARSLGTHPNLTDEQRKRLKSVVGVRVLKGIVGGGTPQTGWLLEWKCQ